MPLIFRVVKRETRLEDRDFELLCALEKWGALGLGQMDGLVFRKGYPREERTRLFFNEIERKDYWLGAYRKLRRLELLGLVRRESYVNMDKDIPVDRQGARGIETARALGVDDLPADHVGALGAA